MDEKDDPGIVALAAKLGCVPSLAEIAARLNVKPPRELGPGSQSRHGTRSRYVSRGCRCPECVQANTDYQIRLKKRYEIRLLPELRVHHLRVRP